MKILVDALSAREGGGLTFVRHALPALARAASARGHETHVLLSPRYQRELISSLPREAQLRSVDLPAGANARRLLFQQATLSRIVRRHAFDLLFTVVEVGAIRPPCPHVVMARNLSIYAPVNTVSGIRGRLQMLMFRVTRQPFALLTARGADRVICVSQWFRDLVLSRTGVDATRLQVVHHGVDGTFTRNGSAPSEGPPHPALAGRPYVLCVSTVAAHKNYETLLDAFSRVPATSEPTLLAIAGGIFDAQLHARLLERARALGIGDRVVFLGRIPHDRLPTLYRNASAFVFPSLLETFGLPLLEAMSSATPVIASSLPVCREVCGDAALYFDARSPEDLTSCLAAVLADDSLRVALAEKGSRRAAQFSWERSAAALVSIFEQVGRERRAGGRSRVAPDQGNDRRRSLV